jgi:hypothetical protein
VTRDGPPYRTGGPYEVLLSRLRHRVSTLQSAMIPFIRGDGATVDPHTLTAIAATVTGRERLRLGCTYSAARVAPTRKAVTPRREAEVTAF